MAETQTYSHLEIQRYLQHKMSAKEMHDFEKALMNDPFLADALEGFSQSDTVMAEMHLSAIENALTDKRKPAKVVPLASQKTSLWKVASVVLIIAFAGILAYSLLYKNQVSLNNYKEIAATKSKVVVTRRDSIGPTDKTLGKTERLADRVLTKQNNGSPIIYLEKSNSNAEVMAMKADTTTMAMNYNDAGRNSFLASAAPAPATNEAPVAKNMKISATPLPRNEFKGKVLDTLDEAVPFATIYDRKSNIGTVSDAHGYFTLKAPDSVLQVFINSPEYPSTLAEVSSKIQVNKIILKGKQPTLSEVVVTALSKKKKTMNANASADTSVGAEPVGGWDNFNQYMNRQLDSLKISEEDDYNDEDIKLEFFVDKRGRPTEIKASEETDKQLGEKAINILANGPKWKNKKKDKKVKVTIQF